MKLHKWYYQKRNSIAHYRAIHEPVKLDAADYIGSMKLKDIKPLDVQRALNAMEQNQVSHSSMREALGRLRECLDFALGNQLI